MIDLPVMWFLYVIRLHYVFPLTLVFSYNVLYISSFFKFVLFLVSAAYLMSNDKEILAGLLKLIYQSLKISSQQFLCWIAMARELDVLPELANQKKCNWQVEDSFAFILIIYPLFLLHFKPGYTQHVGQRSHTYDLFFPMLVL